MNTLPQQLTFPILLAYHHSDFGLLSVYTGAVWSTTLQRKCFSPHDSARHSTNDITRNDSKQQGKEKGK